MSRRTATRGVRIKTDDLKRLQKSFGLTASELSDKCKISSRTIENIMAGRAVSMKSARLIADTLGVHLKNLIDWTEDEVSGPKPQYTPPHGISESLHLMNLASGYSSPRKGQGEEEFWKHFATYCRQHGIGDDQKEVLYVLVAHFYWVDNSLIHSDVYMRVFNDEEPEGG